MISNFKKIQAIPFRPADELTYKESVSEGELVEGLNRFTYKGFVGEDATGKTANGFVHISDGYLEKDFQPFDFITDENIAALGFRFDKRNVPSSAFKAELRKAIDKFKKDKDTVSVSKADRDSIKVAVKMKLISRAVPSTKFVPVIFNIKTGYGYVLTSSIGSAVIITDRLSQALGTTVCIYEGPRTKENEIVDYREFLTWLWWHLEDGDLSIPAVRGKDLRLEVGEDANLVNREDGSAVAAKQAIETARLAVSKGMSAVSLGLSLIDMNADWKLDFRMLGSYCITGLGILPEDLPDTPENEGNYTFLPVMDRLDSIFGTIEEWKKLFIERNSGNKAELTESVRKSWGIGDFCTRIVDDI